MTHAKTTSTTSTTSNLFDTFDKDFLSVDRWRRRIVCVKALELRRQLLFVVVGRHFGVQLRRHRERALHHAMHVRVGRQHIGPA